MRLAPRVALLTLLAALLGCDRVTGIHARQRPVPAPAPNCVRAALAHSPDVLEWVPWQAPWGGAVDTTRFRVIFRDSTARRGTWRGGILTLSPATGGTGVLGLQLQHLNHAGASPAERARTGQFVYRLLGFVAATCGMRPKSHAP